MRRVTPTAKRRARPAAPDCAGCHPAQPEASEKNPFQVIKYQIIQLSGKLTQVPEIARYHGKYILTVRRGGVPPP